MLGLKYPVILCKQVPPPTKLYLEIAQAELLLGVEHDLPDGQGSL